jgi:hypothetical protein
MPCQKETRPARGDSMCSYRRASHRGCSDRVSGLAVRECTPGQQNLPKNEIRLAVLATTAACAVAQLMSSQDTLRHPSWLMTVGARARSWGAIADYSGKLCSTYHICQRKRPSGRWWLGSQPPRSPGQPSQQAAVNRRAACADARAAGICPPSAHSFLPPSQPGYSHNRGRRIAPTSGCTPCSLAKICGCSPSAT